MLKNEKKPKDDSEYIAKEINKMMSSASYTKKDVRKFIEQNANKLSPTNNITEQINKEKRELLKKIGIFGAGALAFAGLSKLANADVLINANGVFKDGKEYSMGGIPYRIVAASDASDESKAKADYVCDGTNDEVEIRQAIQDTDNDGGGIVFLTEGTFNIQDNCYTSNLSNPLVLLGSGMGKTKLVFFSSNYYLIRSSYTNFQKGIFLKDLTFKSYISTSYKGIIFGGTASQASDSKVYLQNCNFEKIEKITVSIPTSGYFVMDNCTGDVDYIFGNYTVADYKLTITNSNINTRYFTGSGININSNIRIFNSYIGIGVKLLYYDNMANNINIYNSEIDNFVLNMNSGDIRIFNSKINNLSGMIGGNLMLINTKLTGTVNDLDKVNLTIGSVL